jgi:hypothetical protein
MATWALIFQNKVWGFYPNKTFYGFKTIKLKWFVLEYF